MLSHGASQTRGYDGARDYQRTDDVQTFFKHFNWHLRCTFLTLQTTPDHYSLHIRHRLLTLWLQLRQLLPCCTAVGILLRSEQLPHEVWRDRERRSTWAVTVNGENKRDEDRVFGQQACVGLSPAGTKRRRDCAEKSVVICKRDLPSLGES